MALKSYDFSPRRPAVNLSFANTTFSKQVTCKVCGQTVETRSRLQRDTCGAPACRNQFANDQRRKREARRKVVLSR